MKISAGKTCLIFFFLFILASPLYPETINDDDHITFFEEFFFLEFFSTDESYIDEITQPDEETLLTEETYLYDDDVSEYDFDEDPLLSDAPTLIIEAPVFAMRSIYDIFPYISPGLLNIAFSQEGFRHFFISDDPPLLTPDPESGIDIIDSVLQTNPSHLIEAILILPYNTREFDLLDIYNAVGRIENIKEQPVLIRGNDFYIFTESTRIQSSTNRRDISDPLPAVTLPFSETIFLRLRETSLGNIFFRGDISVSLYGLTYSMTNFADVRYFLIPVMRAERFITVIYLEPVTEGLLIYSMSGFFLPGFIVDRLNLSPNINRRIEVFIKWITEGLRIQENSAAE